MAEKTEEIRKISIELKGRKESIELKTFGESIMTKVQEKRSGAEF